MKIGDYVKVTIKDKSGYMLDEFPASHNPDGRIGLVRQYGTAINGTDKHDTRLVQFPQTKDAPMFSKWIALSDLTYEGIIQ
jgi:hypothetical protein